MKKNKPILFISCIEASADLYTAALLKHPVFKKYELLGFGGKHLKAIGMKILEDMTPQSTIGFLEPLLKIFYFLNKLNRAKKYLEAFKPDFLLVADGQGFHMPLAEHAQKLRIPVIYFIAPQEWQWGSREGGKKVVQNTDLIMDIYPEATPFYKKLGGNAYFIGHPLLDLVKPTRQYKTENLITLFPGSRKQEIEKLTELFLEAVKPFTSRYQIAVSCSHPRFKKYIQSKLKAHRLNAKLFEEKQYDWMSRSKLVLTASGTITLELAILKKPFIAAYRFGALSYRLAKLILGKRAPQFIAWPNLMADKMITPEFLQDQADPKNIQKQIEKLLSEPPLYKKTEKELSHVTQKLGQTGATSKGQKILLNFIQTN